jgi:hypothetical protein
MLRWSTSFRTRVYVGEDAMTVEDLEEAEKYRRKLAETTAAAVRKATEPRLKPKKWPPKRTSPLPELSPAR